MPNAWYEELASPSCPSSSTSGKRLAVELDSSSDDCHAEAPSCPDSPDTVPSFASPDGDGPSTPVRSKRWKAFKGALQDSPDSVADALALACDSVSPAAGVDLADELGGRAAETPPGPSLELGASDSVELDDDDRLDEALASAADDSQPVVLAASLPEIPLGWRECEPEAADSLGVETALGAACEADENDEYTPKEEEVPTCEPPPVTSPAFLALICIMTTMLSSLNPAARENFEASMVLLAEYIIDSCCVGMTLTSACSGSDLVCPVLQAFFNVCTDHLRTAPVKVQHLWSCEFTPWKASWIERVIGMGTVFRDVHELPTGRAFTHRWIHELVSAGLLHVCGFSCKSVSMLNNGRKKFLKCIRQRTGSTGSTFWSTWKFAWRYLPVFCWMENVSAFRGANLNMAVKCFRALGYCVVVLTLDLSKHGVPCRRKRTWILARLDPTNSGEAACSAYQQAADTLELSLRQPPLPLDRFLFPDDALPCRKAPKKRKLEGSAEPFANRMKWVAAHKARWAKASVNKPDELPAALMGMVAEHQLSGREVDLALYDRASNSSKYEETSKERVIDLSQSISRYPSGTGVVPTITPNARLALVGRRNPRFIVGQERLALQGFVAEMAEGELGGEAILSFTDRPSF